jgi:hypothetical protein
MLLSVHQSIKLEWEFPQRLEWEGRTKILASQKPRSYPDGFFFLWFYNKNIVYGEKIRDLRHLLVKITAAVATVTPDSADLARERKQMERILKTKTWRYFLAI